jgi:thioredoxin 1
MKNKVFSDVEWDESFKNFVGLPRPFSKVLKKHRINSKLSAKVPIPWQSRAKNDDDGFLRLIQENEDSVYYKNLCSYCGIKISDNENVTRWKSGSLNEVRHGGQFVFSDIHPLHLQCMEQARIYCPGMRKRDEKEFEYGSYLELKKNSEKEKGIIFKMIITNFVNVFYFTADWCQPCKNIKPIVNEINRDSLGIKFHTIDADIEKDLVKQFQIQSLPTFIIISKGKEVKRLVGSQKRDSLEDLLKYAEELRLSNHNE